MSHLQRISWLLGSVLLGVSAVLIYQKDRVIRQRRRDVPVEKLADDLKHAWASYHTP